MKNRFFSPYRILLGVLGTIFVLALLLQTPSQVDAYSPHNLVGKWDRLNPDSSNPTPEHEILLCGGNSNWNCVYEKQPEPGLNFETPPNSGYGKFRGEDITTDWECPSWFPDEICDNTIQVVGGVMVYGSHIEGEGGLLIVDVELILAEFQGNQVLYMHWVNIFIAPWYRSFDEALAANPFPLPFNGEDWPAMDAITP